MDYSDFSNLHLYPADVLSIQEYVDYVDLQFFTAVYGDQRRSPHHPIPIVMNWRHTEITTSLLTVLSHSSCDYGGLLSVLSQSSWIGHKRKLRLRQSACRHVALLLNGQTHGIEEGGWGQGARSAMRPVLNTYQEVQQVIYTHWMFLETFYSLYLRWFCSRNIQRVWNMPMNPMKAKRGKAVLVEISSSRLGSQPSDPKDG